MNNKGQVLGLTILSILGVIIIGFMFLNFILPEVTNFRTALTCSDADNISDGTKVLCLIGDSTVPIYVIALFTIVTGVVARRFFIR